MRRQCRQTFFVWAPSSRLLPPFAGVRSDLAATQPAASIECVARDRAADGLGDCVKLARRMLGLKPGRPCGAAPVPGLSSVKQDRKMTLRRLPADQQFQVDFRQFCAGSLPRRHDRGGSTRRKRPDFHPGTVPPPCRWQSDRRFGTCRNIDQKSLKLSRTERPADKKGGRDRRGKFICSKC